MNDATGAALAGPPIDLDAPPPVALPGPATAPAVEAVPAASPPPPDALIGRALIILAAIALIGALYFARAFFVPLLIGILASYTLRPLVDWLEAWRLPRAIAAACVLLLLVGGLGWLGVALRDDVGAMIEKLPDAARKLRQSLNASRAGTPTALQKLQEVATELQGAAADAGVKPGTRPAPVARPVELAPWLSDYAVAQSALFLTVAGQTPIVLLLAYFLLASGAHFRRKLVQFVGPSLARKKGAVRILEEIDVQVQRYLLAMLLSNALVGAATWLALKAIGLEYAGVWGVAAGILHFIPYLGAALLAIAVGVAAFLQFGTLLQALLVAGTAVLLATLISQVFMTWLQSRFARVNAAVLFIALLFFAWLWGAAGLLLGAPLLAIAKVICDRVESLKPAGELLGK